MVLGLYPSVCFGRNGGKAICADGDGVRGFAARVSAGLVDRDSCARLVACWLATGVEIDSTILCVWHRCAVFPWIVPRVTFSLSEFLRLTHEIRCLVLVATPVAWLAIVAMEFWLGRKSIEEGHLLDLVKGIAGLAIGFSTRIPGPVLGVAAVLVAFAAIVLQSRTRFSAAVQRRCRASQRVARSWDVLGDE